MPFENPQGGEFEDFGSCKRVLVEDGMGEAAAERLCGKWQAWFYDQRGLLQTVNQQDPTQTQTRRESLRRQFSSRWATVRGRNRRWVEDHETLRRRRMQGQYRRFFEGLASNEVVEPASDRSVARGRHWTATHITDAYDKGLRLARQDMQTFDPPQSVIDRATDRNQQRHREAREHEYQKLYYTAQDHVTYATSQATNLLREGIDNRESTRWFADEVNSMIRGKVRPRYTDAAHTAVPRAVNEALLTAFEIAGVTEIGVAVENQTGQVASRANMFRVNAEGELVFTTAGDDRVCPVCAALAGEVVKIESIRDSPDLQPPIHPRCRCRLVPTTMQVGGEEVTAPAVLGVAAGELVGGEDTSGGEEGEAGA